jgi:hypothetical protein
MQVWSKRSSLVHLQTNNICFQLSQTLLAICVMVHFEPYFYLFGYLDIAVRFYGHYQTGFDENRVITKLLVKTYQVEYHTVRSGDLRKCCAVRFVVARCIHCGH